MRQHAINDGNCKFSNIINLIDGKMMQNAPAQAAATDYFITPAPLNPLCNQSQLLDERFPNLLFLPAIPAFVVLMPCSH